MTQNARGKRRTRLTARETGQSFVRVQRAVTGAGDDPWRAEGPDDAGSVDGYRPPRSRAELERLLDQAEQSFRSEDPYRQQAAYGLAAQVYEELAGHTDDATWGQAARMAGQRMAIEAARIRWQHGIPTILPGAEAALLGFGMCVECGRPWQAGTEGACPRCPRLRHGPTPRAAGEASRLGHGREVDFVALIASRYRGQEDD
ncbi:MAG: hypothetical protein HOV94_40320 [Saccharothrix sp.]|nr:hypothetical protein [Saccharothrix sp.]